MLSLGCFSLYRDEYYHSVTAFAGVFTGHIDFTIVFLLSGFCSINGKGVTTYALI
jgi:hypothetical protein